MKSKTILLLVFLVWAAVNSIFGQTVNDIPIKDIETEYLLIVGTTQFLSTKITIQIDFGQSKQFFGQYGQTILKDEKGLPLKFNSMIDALNFLGQNGYEFVDAYAITVGNQNVYHYLMRKKM